MSMIAMYHLDLKSFTFHKDKRSLTAFASDFGAMRDTIDVRTGLPRWICPVYDDACDLGIAIRSHATDKVEKFYWDERQGRDNDYTGGYAFYVFKPIALCPIDTVTIYND